MTCILEGNDGIAVMADVSYKLINKVYEPIVTNMISSTGADISGLEAVLIPDFTKCFFLQSHKNDYSSSEKAQEAEATETEGPIP
jgi:hypothetical protein